MANETTENNISGLNSIPVTAPTSKTALTPKGTLALDPTQTQSILENMQRMIDQRESALSLFTSGLKDAAAWGSGGAEGPSRALAARDEQKAKEAKELFDMRTQMASYKAAQSKQQAFEKRRAQELGGGEGAGAAPAAGGVQIPAPIRRAMANARTEEEYDKIFTAWAQEDAKTSANPEMDVPKVPVVVENPDGSFTRKVISVREYRANPNLYKDTPETQPALKAAAPAAAPEGDMRAKIKKGVFSTESSSGKADTTKPGIQGAVGPMQITADTWATNVSRGVIPKDLDINNPQHNKIAGEKILDYYYDKYNGDVDKTLAAYHGGEGAINSDGTINRERKDQLGTSIGDYITKTKAAMGVTTAPTPAVAAKGPRPTPEQLEAESRVKSTFREQQAKGAAENVQKAQLSFETAIEPASVSERKTSAERVEKLVLDNPEATGILAKEGVGNALLTIIRDGLNTPSGAVGIKTIEDALILSMPGTSQKAINARREIAQNLAKGALEASKLSQGQGSVSDFERSMFERIAGSLADTPELLIKRQRMLIARANLDTELGKMYRRTKKPGEPLDFDVFRTSKEYENKVAAYEKELRGILDSEVEIKGAAAAPKHPGASVIKKYPPRTTP